MKILNRIWDYICFIGLGLLLILAMFTAVLVIIGVFIYTLIFNREQLKFMLSNE